MNTRKNNNKRIRILPMAALVVLLVAIPITLYTLFHAKSTRAEWFNASWGYRQSIRFTNGGSAVTDQKVLISFDTATPIAASKMQGSCQDVRFTDAAGKQLQYYINVSGGAGIGCNDASSDFYVLMPSIVAGDNLIYIYYGNPSALAGTASANFGNTTFSPSAGPTAASEEVTPGPVAYWKFDENQGSTANDATGHGNSLTLTSTSWATSSASQSNRTNYLQFNGTTSVASRANDTEFDFGTGSFSVSAWFRHASTASFTDVLITKYNTAGWKVYMNASGFICFGIDDDSTWGPDDSACSTTSYADSTWHHVEVVKNSTTSITVYVDGNQVAQTTSLTATGTLSTTATLYVGADSSGATSWWDGAIDDIAIYPYARSSVQVKNDRGGSDTAVVMGAQTADPLTNGLVGWWKMDENTGTSGTDHSGNGVSLTTAGNTSWTTGKFGSAISSTVDGVNSGLLYTDTSDKLDFSNIQSFTYSFWYRASSAESTSIAPFIKGAGTTSSMGYNWEINSSNDAKCKYTDGDGVGDDRTSATLAIWNDGFWHHVTCVMDRNTNKFSMYVDGVFSGSDTNLTEGSAATSTVDLKLGDGLSATEYEGAIDEVRVYSRALSQSEVSRLYNYAPGPVGWWKMDENTGQSLYDSSGNGFTGTVGADTSISSDDPKWVVGKFGSALNFDGVNDDVRIADTDSLSFGNASANSDKPYTFETWVYPTNNISHYFIDKSGEYSMRLGSDGRLICTQTDNSAGAYIGRNYSSGIAINGWHHVACTYDGSGTSAGTKIYLDGIRVDNSNESAGTYTAMENLGNAFHLWESSEPWIGKLDDVKIYNYVRNSSQIVEDMNGGHPPGGSPVESDIIHWKFDEAQGATANNAGYGGSTYNSTISGATWYPGGKIGSAIATTTSTNFVSAGDQSFVDNLTGLTAGFWVKPVSLATNKALISKSNMSSQNSFAVVTDNSASDEVRVHIPTSVSDIGTYFLTSNMDLANDSWSYVNVIYNASESASTRVRVYKNGKEIAGSVTGTFPDKMTTGTTSLLKVGASDSGSYTALNAVFDEVKIYPYPLTYDQMLIDYNQKSAMVLGSLSTDSDGVTASNSASREFCVPGDTTSCDPPIGYWKMDEKTGTSIYDSSVNGVTGAFGGGLTGKNWSVGKKGSGITMDGNDDYIDIYHSTLFDFGTNPFSMNAWIKFGTSASSQVIIAQTIAVSGNFAIAVLSNGVVQVAVKGVGSTWCTINGTTTVNDSRWHHISVVLNRNASCTTSDFLIYIDGQKDSSTVADASANSNASSVDNGGIKISEQGSQSINGTVDDVKIYSYARTPAQIAWEYNKGAPVARYTFDECQGTTIYNQVQNADGKASGNNGTLTIGATGTYTSAGTCGSGTSTEAWNGGTTGKFGSSLAFDGTNDYVTLSGTASPAPSTGLTVSAWINVDSLVNGTNYTIFAKQTWASKLGFRLSLNGTGGCANLNCLFIGVGDGVNQTETVGSGINMTDVGNWHHVVGTFSSGDIALYVDGNQRYTTTSSVTSIVNDSVAGRIGRHSNGNEYFPGKLDDIRVYNYALTPAQIKIVMNEGSAVRFGP